MTNESSIVESSGQPKPVELSGQQLVLYKALVKKNQLVAKMYLGALSVYQQNINPDRLALTAHGLRELMEKLPRHLDMPLAAQPSVVTKRPSMKEKVKALLQDWKKAKKNSKCFDKQSWSGEIDGHLQKYLTQSEEFSQWVEADHPTRKQQTGKVLRRLDPQSRPLPPTIEDLRIKEWDQCHDYLEGVSHHNPDAMPEEFGRWLDVLEGFLLDSLCPRTYDDRSTIDEIIREGEPDAKP